MKKLIIVLLAIAGGIALFIKIGSSVVNFLIGLLPQSIHEWYPILKVVFWIVTASFDLTLTIIVIYIFLGVVLASNNGGTTTNKKPPITKSRFQQRLDALAEEKRNRGRV